MNDLLSGLLELVQSVDPVLRTLLAGLGMFFETSLFLGVLVPGDSIVIVASTALGGLGEYLALLLAVVVGSLAGESVGFALGHYFGPRIRRSRIGARLGESHWARAERYLDRRGGIAVFLSRFLPVLHSLIPVTVGMSRMSYRRFMAWTVPACLVWAIAYVSVGWLAAGSYRELSTELHSAGYVFVGILVGFLLMVLAVKKIVARREARHMLEQQPRQPRRPQLGKTDKRASEPNTP